MPSHLWSRYWESRAPRGWLTANPLCAARHFTFYQNGFSEFPLQLLPGLTKPADFPLPLSLLYLDWVVARHFTFYQKKISEFPLQLLLGLTK